MNNKKLFSDLIFMVKLTSLCSILLLATRAAVGERAELSVRTADSILELLEIKSMPSESIAIDGFKRRFARRQNGKIKLWQMLDNPDIWACEATGSGMWGEITIAFVVNSKTWAMKGVRVIEQKETVGLGARIAEDWFCEKFVGLNASNGVKAVGVKVLNNEFDCISGATISSKSVEKLINKSLSSLKQKVGYAR